MLVKVYYLKGEITVSNSMIFYETVPGDICVEHLNLL